MQRRAVPWVDWAEWRGVRDLLFAADLAQRRRGVQRVAAWRSRCAPLGPLPQPSSASSSPRRCRDRGRLPVSVECTGFIVEAWLSESALPPPSEVQLRLAYAMALLRLVNGICDPSQRGKAASPPCTGSVFYKVLFKVFLKLFYFVFFKVFLGGSFLFCIFLKFFFY